MLALSAKGGSEQRAVRRPILCLEEQTSHSIQGMTSGISAKRFAGRAVLIFDTEPKSAVTFFCHASNCSNVVIMRTGLLVRFQASVCIMVPGAS